MASHDVVVVDCPPQLSLVTVNVLAAVDEVIVPVDAGIYSVAGLAQLQQAVVRRPRVPGQRDSPNRRVWS